MGNFLKDVGRVLSGQSAVKGTADALGLGSSNVLRKGGYNPFVDYYDRQDADIQAEAAKQGRIEAGLVDGSARKTMAQLTREQWADYKTRFAPLETELLGYYDNLENRAERIGAARGLAGQAFDAVERDQRVQLGRYGLGKRADDPAFNRGLGLSRAAADVDAANTTRQHLAERDNLIMTGGLTSRRGDA